MRFSTTDICFIQYVIYAAWKAPRYNFYILWSLHEIFVAKLWKERRVYEVCLIDFNPNLGTLQKLHKGVTRA